MAGRFCVMCSATSRPRPSFSMWFVMRRSMVPSKASDLAFACVALSATTTVWPASSNTRTIKLRIGGSSSAIRMVATRLDGSTEGHDEVCPSAHRLGRERQGGEASRRLRLLQRSTNHQPVSVKQLAISMSSTAFREITWREGTDRKLQSRFAAVRVRVAHRDYEKAEPHAEEWLLMEWPRGEKEPTKYWISTLPADTELRALVKMAKHRWIIERDYEELKQELGLGHFEGRNWRGFHHHATLCIAA